MISTINVHMKYFDNALIYALVLGTLLILHD